MKRGKGGRPYTGNALKDGFTCLKKPMPRIEYGDISVMQPDRGDTFEEMTEFMVEMGGANTARRRLRDHHDNDYD